MYRMHECHCGEKWQAIVEYSKSTPNLSGEKTPYCPKCGKRAAYSQPIGDIAMTKKMSTEDFLSFLQDTLIPDLKESGHDCTAEDFETCVSIIRAKHNALSVITEDPKISAMLKALDPMALKQCKKAQAF